MNIGYTQRAKRRVHVLKGFDPSESNMIDKAAPVASGETIKSGQLVALNASGEWELATATNGGTHAGQIIYVAIADSSDTDVSASGLLPALSCAGSYEIETGYFSEDPTEGAALSCNAGSLVLADAAGDYIIGYATSGVEDLGRTSGLPVKDNTASNVEVVSFVTSHQATPVEI